MLQNSFNQKPKTLTSNKQFIFYALSGHFPKQLQQSPFEAALFFTAGFSGRCSGGLFALKCAASSQLEMPSAQGQ